jgi:TOMM system kinase/cyclase fusion protein
VNPLPTDAAATGQARVQPGATVHGRYEILDEIGSGGFGTVYKARQLATDQFVAIKVLRSPDQQGPSWDRRLARFLREVRVCGRLHHPNIVRLIDSDRSDDGRVFTAFEYVPGRTLADVLWQEGALDPVEAKHLMLQVLDALASAHAEGVVHRDLKPRNIMITEGARRNALVLDFGISALVGRQDDEIAESITVTGEVLGSPAYSAPEQLLRAEPTPRSDLFSWALVFIECLTGIPSTLGEPLHRIVMRLLDNEPVRIPGPLTTHPLGEILRRALVKDVSSREVTAKGLLRDLEACDLRDLTRAVLTADAADPSGERQAFSTVDDRTIRSQTSGPARRERRQVTALCVRIEPPPEWSQPSGAEDFDDHLDELQRLIEKTSGRFGGIIAGAGPDSVVACFGYPTARGDDAARAAQAALAVHAAVHELRSASPRSLVASIATGIHTGLIVARDHLEGRSALGPVVGLAVRRASSVARAATPGEILVSSETCRLTESSFEYDGERSIAVDAVTLGASPLRGRRAQDSTQTVRHTALVGRDRDVAHLVELARKARGGFGQAVLVHGEAGIGKSRLAHDVIRDLRRDGFAMLEARCSPDAVNRAFHPFIDLFERTLGLGRDTAPDSGPPVGALRRLETLVRTYRVDANATVPLLATLLGIPLEDSYPPIEHAPPKLKEMTSDAVLLLLAEIADAQPTVLLFEDLHWCDPTSRELLARLVAEVPASRLVLMMTARPEFVPSWSPSSAASLPLARLARVDVERLVTEVTQDTPLPPFVLDNIVERTDGVPLFVEELLWTLLGSGDLVVRQGRYELSRPIGGLDVPTTLRASLTARLDRLGRAKQTAQLAAVIGREFRLDVLTALSAHPEAELRQDIDVLLAADLVHGRRRLRETTYSFKHALVRDAAYELLPKNSRQKHHARLADLLEKEFPHVAETRPELLAKHCALANQVKRAVGYAQLAAAAGLKRSANAEVVAFLNEALSWLDGLDSAPERATAELQLISLLTVALMATQGWGSAEVAKLMARATELVPQVDDAQLATRTTWTSLMYYNVRAERKEAYALAKSLVTAAEDRGDTDTLVAALPVLGSSLFLMGELTECCRQLDRCVALYDRDRHRNHAVLIYGLDAKAYADMSISLALWLVGRREEAWARGRHAVEWARELKSGPSEGLALMYLAGLAHYERDRRQSQEIVETMTDVVNRHDLALFKAFKDLLRGWVDGNAELANGANEQLRSSGQEIDRSYWLSLAAECEARAGDYRSALAHIDECIQHANRTGEPFYLAELHRMKGEWLLASDPGARDAAEEALRRAVDLAQQAGQPPVRLRASVALGRLLMAKGLRDEAAACVSAACDWPGQDADWAELREAKQLLMALN